MVVLPLSPGDSAVRIGEFAYSVKLWVLEIAPINLPIFPFESSFPIDLVVDELALQDSVVCLNGPQSLPFPPSKLPPVLQSFLSLNQTVLVVH